MGDNKGVTARCSSTVPVLSAYHLPGKKMTFPLSLYTYYIIWYRVGQQASPGPQRCSVHGDGQPVRKGSAPMLFSMMCGSESCRYYFCVDPG